MSAARSGWRQAKQYHIAIPRRKPLGRSHSDSRRLLRRNPCPSAIRKAFIPRCLLFSKEEQ